MKKITLLISAITLCAFGFSQNLNKIDAETKEADWSEKLNNIPTTYRGGYKCVTAEAESLKSELNPNHQTTIEFENWISQKIKDLKSNPSYGNKATRNIPVVVHVLYGNSTQNISDAQILSQIVVLNEDFSATNADFANTPAEFNSVIGSMDIQFCLAKEDPNGNPTNGITRTSVPTSTISDIQVETNYGLNNMWDPTKYLNIFVGNITANGQLIGGKSVFPVASNLPGMPTGTVPDAYDAVMITFDGFGTVGALFPPYDKGRTTTHEIGHFLGLRHIDGDATCGDDFCADTPTQNTLTFGCPSYPQNSCSSSDMFMNFLDYTNDVCLSTFTMDQKLRVDAVLMNSPNRKELLTSTTCSLSTGQNEISGLLNNVVVYPNPTAGILNIELEKTANSTVTIINVLGEVIASQTNNSALFTFDINNQPKGVYFIKITISSEVITKKVLLTK